MCLRVTISAINALKLEKKINKVLKEVRMYMQSIVMAIDVNARDHVPRLNIAADANAKTHSSCPDISFHFPTGLL
jgi:hypothetical protein